MLKFKNNNPDRKLSKFKPKAEHVVWAIMGILLIVLILGQIGIKKSIRRVAGEVEWSNDDLFDRIKDELDRKNGD